MLGRIGIPELAFIFLIVILLFGAKSIPEIARGLAKGMRLFKKELQGVADDAELEQVNKARTESLKTELPTQENKIGKHNDFDSHRKRRDWRSDATSQDK